MFYSGCVKTKEERYYTCGWLRPVAEGAVRILPNVVNEISREREGLQKGPGPGTLCVFPSFLNIINNYHLELRSCAKAHRDKVCMNKDTTAHERAKAKQSGHWEKAVELLRQMQEEGVAANAICYNADGPPWGHEP